MAFSLEANVTLNLVGLLKFVEAKTKFSLVCVSQTKCYLVECRWPYFEQIEIIQIYLFNNALLWFSLKHALSLIKFDQDQTKCFLSLVPNTQNSILFDLA
jgi:hypothetical protein